jgi:hypothetical protein
MRFAGETSVEVRAYLDSALVQELIQLTPGGAARSLLPRHARFASKR